MAAFTNKALGLGKEGNEKVGIREARKSVAESHGEHSVQVYSGSKTRVAPRAGCKS